MLQARHAHIWRGGGNRHSGWKGSGSEAPHSLACSSGRGGQAAPAAGMAAPIPHSPASLAAPVPVSKTLLDLLQAQKQCRAGQRRGQRPQAAWPGSSNQQSVETSSACIPGIQSGSCWRHGDLKAARLSHVEVHNAAGVEEAERRRNVHCDPPALAVPPKQPARAAGRPELQAGGQVSPSAVPGREGKQAGRDCEAERARAPRAVHQLSAQPNHATFTPVQPFHRVHRPFHFGFIPGQLSKNNSPSSPASLHEKDALWSAERHAIQRHHVRVPQLVQPLSLPNK